MPLSPDSPLARLMTAPVRSAAVVWLGIRPQRHAPMTMPPVLSLVAGRGIDGDRYKTTRNGGRQVTLIAEEDLTAIAGFLGLNRVAPETVRRNIVTRGVNLIALKDRRFRLGTALLEGAGDCAPCSRMEEALGTGGYNAMRGRGGLTARIIESGDVRIGDAIEPLV